MRPGALLPADGVVLSGDSTVEESMVRECVVVAIRMFSRANHEGSESACAWFIH